jgi:hypothetical protein
MNFRYITLQEAVDLYESYLTPSEIGRLALHEGVITLEELYKMWGMHNDKEKIEFIKSKL